MSENAASGVITVELKSKAGLVKIFLPDDISAGDTVSAAVALYPAGVTSEAMDGNLRILGGYVIETSFFNVPASQKSVKISVPRNSAGTKMKFTLRDASMKPLDSASVPIGLSSAVRDEETPTPYDYQCPLIGQAGRTVEIKGPFDGDFATTDFKIGNKKANVIAESPRKLVFESPADVVGSVEVVLVERDVEVRRPFTCLQVLKIGEGDAVPVVSGSQTLPPARTASAGRDERSPAPGVQQRELPPASQSLEFSSVKAEDNLTPQERPSDTPARASIPGGSSEEIRLVLASQMESSASLDGSVVKAPAVAETGPSEPSGNNVPAVTEARPPVPARDSVPDVSNTETVSDGETLKEAPIESLPEEPRREDSRPPATTAGIPLGTRANSSDGSTAEMIEGQLLASFTGGAHDNAVPDAADSGVRQEPRPKSGGGFTVQVASYRDRKDAEELEQRLARKGYQAFVAEAVIPGKGKWYRVRVGRFGTRKEAASFGESLKRKERSLKSVYVAEDD
ncbi:MAG TPA: SPOR domain-containing protein [Thermodesulfobacteriota bacterium]|nr:SPOR domain-containing protein [Thermodesulfobacteriota bacterium]